MFNGRVRDISSRQAGKDQLRIVSSNSKQHTPASPALSTLEDRLGYRFADSSLLNRALTHRSYAFEQGRREQGDNETLEFLGDAVIDLAVGHGLFLYFPEMREGDLTRLRAALVNEQHLAQMAADLELGCYLLLGRGEETSAGRNKSSILSCAFEAVAGAIFLDGGYGAAEAFVQRQFPKWFAEKRQEMFMADAKSALQELLQERFSEGPAYVLEGEEGPEHSKIFHVAVRFRNEILGRGSARSKKKAEQEAASLALENLAAEGGKNN